MNDVCSSDMLAVLEGSETIGDIHQISFYKKKSGAYWLDPDHRVISSNSKANLMLKLDIAFPYAVLIEDPHPDAWIRHDRLTYSEVSKAKKLR